MIRLNDTRRRRTTSTANAATFGLRRPACARGETEHVARRLTLSNSPGRGFLVLPSVVTQVGRVDRVPLHRADAPLQAEQGQVVLDRKGVVVEQDVVVRAQAKHVSQYV